MPKITRIENCEVGFRRIQDDVDGNAVWQFQAFDKVTTDVTYIRFGENVRQVLLKELLGGIEVVSEVPENAKPARKPRSKAS